jgi:hypothetical protein
MKHQSENKPRPRRLVEGIDFVVENGLYVFTAKYLLERGYCCENGCRNCPYGFQKKSKAN